MASLRRVALLGLLVVVAQSGSLVLSQGGQTIGGYTLLNEVRVTRTISEYTYRATLINNGGALAGATATAVSLSPKTTIVDGALTFGAVVAGGTVVSTDTFSFQQDRTIPFDWTNIIWTITPQAA